MKVYIAAIAVLIATFVLTVLFINVAEGRVLFNVVDTVTSAAAALIWGAGFVTIVYEANRREK